MQLGVEVLKDFQREAKFPFLCANLVDKATKKPIFKPSAVFEIAGLKLGVYSVLFTLTNDTYRNRVLPNEELLDPEVVSREVVAELRKSCDLVIALSHLNVETNEKLLDTNPGIDVLIDPLSRTGTKNIWITENEYLVEHKGTPILRIDGQGSRVGVFEMYFQKGSKKIAEYQVIDGALEPHIMRHPEMAQLVHDFELGRVQSFPINFDVTRPRLFDDAMGHEGCGSCHAEQLAFWKSTKHADTYSTLVKTNDHLRTDCVGCHSVGYGVTFAATAQVDRFKEVQCESCHGFKSDHASTPKTVKMGAVAEDTCWGCHNPDITKKSFHDVYPTARPRLSCPKIQK